jgi:hypothetical protein
MNLVLENLVQGALNGVEDILLKFQSQIRCDNFHRIKEPSNVWEDDLLSDFIIENLYFEERFRSHFTKNISKFQEDLYEYSYEEFLSCCDDIFPSPSIPTKVVQVTTKREGTKRKRYLHRSPLNLQGEVILC